MTKHENQTGRLRQFLDSPYSTFVIGRTFVIRHSSFFFNGENLRERNTVLRLHFIAEMGEVGLQVDFAGCAARRTTPAGGAGRTAAAFGLVAVGLAATGRFDFVGHEARQIREPDIHGEPSAQSFGERHEAFEFRMQNLQDRRLAVEENLGVEHGELEAELDREGFGGNDDVARQPRTAVEDRVVMVRERTDQPTGHQGSEKSSLADRRGAADRTDFETARRFDEDFSPAAQENRVDDGEAAEGRVVAERHDVLFGRCANGHFLRFSGHGVILVERTRDRNGNSRDSVGRDT